MEMLAELPTTGYYFSLFKLAVLLVLAVPWLYLGPWLSKDTRVVHASQEVWTLLYLAAGILGLAIWLLMPIYIVGLLVFFVLFGAALGAYVVYRNGRVPENQKLFTREHLSSLSSPRKEKKVDITSRVKVYSQENRVVTAPPAEATAEEKEAYNLAQNLLYDVLFYRASEADITPVGQEARVRLVIDGVVSEQPTLEIPQSEAIINYLKPYAGMNPQERRRPQQGKITVDIANSPVEMILTTAGTTGGQRIQFKIVQQFVQTQLDSLGMTPEILQKIKAITALPTGMMIVSGKSGSGVTSTLYSILRAQDAFMKQLVTMEDKPVVDLENVTQVAYGDSSKLPAMLATTIRRDPDLLMLDNCEDPKAAQVLLPYVSRKMGILGLRAGTAFEALAKWIKLCGSADQAVANLHGVLCQILVRKLCPKCREEYHPDPRFLAKVNMPSQKIENFYRPPTSPLVDEKGQPYTCPTCQGNGYFGRTAVFEFLEITDDIRQLIASGASLTQIQSACRKNKMLYIQEQALRKVVEGVTSIQEVIRVTQQSKK